MYSKFFIITIFLFCFLQTKFAFSKLNSPEPSQLIVIGTVHASTHNFTSDTLLHILEKIKPDLILVECDSSYMTQDFELKEDVKYSFPETMAITAYLKNKDAKIRPYDISGRDNIMNDYERVMNQRNIFPDIETLLRNGKLSNYGTEMLDRILSMMNMAEEMTNSTSAYINSHEGSRKIDTINYYTYTGFEQLVNAEPGLSQYISYCENEKKFWNNRNETMLENILTFKKAFEGKKIVILCGFSHKNFLVNGLKTRSIAENLIVRDYFEFLDQ